MKIGWILSSGKNVASSRIHGWNMHESFTKKGLDSNIIYHSKKYGKSPEINQEDLEDVINDKYDLIIIVGFKSDENLKGLIKTFQNSNVKVVYIKTDEIPEDIVEITDATIMVTDFAKKEMPKKLHSKIHVVFDGYEHDGKKHKIHSLKKNIKLVFISNNVYDKFPQIEELPKDVELLIIGPPKERVKRFTPHKKMFTETPYDFKYKIWDLNSVEKDILDCDVAVIPYSDKHLKADFVHRKSSNRLVLFMSYSIPTIVSPISEYLRLIQNEKNGFIAKSKEDWQKYIKLLRDNPSLRKKVGSEGRLSVIKKYSKEAQMNEYLKIFKNLVKNNN